MPELRRYFEHYFAPHPSREVREMMLSVSILNFATASIALFEPVYLYRLGLSLVQVIMFYGALYVLYFFALPLGGRICRRHGYEHSILYSSPFLILYYLSLFATRYDFRFLGIALVALVVQKILYWPGYHSNLVNYGDGAEQGREISNVQTLAAASSAVAPFFGGAVITWLGYPVLFILVAALILLSNLPLLRAPELFEPQPFSYGAAVKRLFKRKNLRKLASFLGFGEEIIALVLWPIFVLITIPDYLSAGAIISVAIIVSMFVTLYVGRLSDEGNRESVLRVGGTYTAASWLLRPLIVGGFGVFLAESFYRVSKSTAMVPLTSMVYDGARRGRAMESIVFFEMALALGKIMAALLAIAIFTAAPSQSAAWTALFILGTAFAGGYMLLKENGGVED